MSLRKLIAAAMAAVLFGCGSGESRLETIPVKGILYLDDKAFGPAMLQFTPETANEAAPVVNAYVKKDGSFQLQTYKEGDGAPVGRYNVVLSMDPIAAGPVPAVKPLIIEVAKPAGGGPVQLDVKLESSGGDMISPLPPPGQEGGGRSGLGAGAMSPPGSP